MLNKVNQNEKIKYYISHTRNQTYKRLKGQSKRLIIGTKR